MPSSSPADRPSENANTVEPLIAMMRVPLLDHVFSTCHCSSPQSSACRPRPMCRRPLSSNGGLKTPPCDVPPSAMRSTQVAAAGFRRPRTCRRRRRSSGAARRTSRGGDRGEHRILVVFAHRHDPHVDAVLPHEGRQEGVQPLRAIAAASPPVRAASRTAASTAADLVWPGSGATPRPPRP